MASRRNRAGVAAITYLTGPVILLAAASLVAASCSGNHPEANTCPKNKPYYSLCTNALHNLEGWYGACRVSREVAQQDADAHVKKYHNGNSRWTGVRKAANEFSVSD